MPLWRTYKRRLKKATPGAECDFLKMCWLDGLYTGVSTPLPFNPLFTYV